MKHVGWIHAMRGMAEVRYGLRRDKWGKVITQESMKGYKTKTIYLSGSNGRNWRQDVFSFYAFAAIWALREMNYSLCFTSAVVNKRGWK